MFVLDVDEPGLSHWFVAEWALPFRYQDSQDTPDDAELKPEGHADK